MPTYHYRCAKCEQHIEVVQSMTDDPITECAACGGKMQKVLRPVGIVLKGSGFYRTDNRAKTGGSPRSEPKTESKPSESKSSGDSKTASDSKPSTPKSDTKSA